jgi:REP element-mobilizing transposase RayT
MNQMALAYFITFSTYGTWLHGSAKGMGSVDVEHNAYGSPYVAPDAERECHERETMAQAVYVMDAPRRAVVCDAIVRMAQEKGWRLWAVHVRSNHVHTVVTADREPGRLMSDLKARASRELAGLDERDRRRWTRHGSTKHLFEWAQVEEKIDYTLYAQGPPMALYDGTEEPYTK